MVDLAALVEERIDKIGTQYRESPNIIGTMRAYLNEIAEAYAAIEALPGFFDLDTAVGDQLTILGKHLGFPRCQKICTDPPVFGYPCTDVVPAQPTVRGYCENVTYADCTEIITNQLCILDDDLYRRILKVRRFQYLGLFDFDSAQAAAREMWGPQAIVLDRRDAREVVFAPFRLMTDIEEEALPIIFRALPIAPGVRGTIHKGTRPVFGYGAGLFGYCEAVPENDECNYLTYGKLLNWDDSDLWADSDVWQEGSPLVGQTITAYCDGDDAPDPCNYRLGYGSGESGYCETTEGISDYLCPEDPRPYRCAT